MEENLLNRLKRFDDQRPSLPGEHWMALSAGLWLLGHRGDAFRDGTRDHDVSQNVDALLRHIEGPAPFEILDLGCGPGRDLRTFTRLGHRPVGLDGSARFVEMARADSGCEVWHQDFLALE